MEHSLKRPRGRYLVAILKAWVVVNGLTFATVSQSASNVEGNIYGSAPAAGTVEVKSLETGASLSNPVRDDGTFRFPSVLPGHYRVTYTSSAGQAESKDVTVTLGQGEQVRFEAANAPGKLETVVVTASYSAVDTASVESATNISSKQIEALPLARRIDAVQLLAPDSGIGSPGLTNVDGTPLVSFGGSSVLENAFFINGFNITDFRRGLGGAAVPFEFYKDIEVKTGGYSAEFGRSLGGVVNAVSKTGSNEFNAGVNVFWEPDWGHSNSPNYRVAGQIYRDYQDDTRSDTEYNVYASGALIPDRVFLYGSLGGRNLQTSHVAPSFGHAEQSTQFGRLSNSPVQYAFNLLANLAPGHTLQVTTFSDITRNRFTSNGYDLNTGKSFGNTNPYNRLNGVGETETGGRFLIANYSGQVTDWFNLSALLGRGYNLDNGFNTTDAGGPCPTISDLRGTTSSVLGCVPAAGNAVDTNEFDSNIKDTRTAARLDAIFSFSALGDHQLKVGYDFEKLKTDVHYQFTGGGTYYEYDTCQDAAGCDVGGVNVANGTEYMFSRFETTDGTFDQYLNAFYIEDSWQVTPQLMIVAGVRNDSFDQRDLSNQSFIKSKNNWGPRFGFSLDPMRSGKTKIYANWGRYYMPTQTDLAVRNLAIANDLTTYYTYSSIGPDGMPVNPVQVGDASGFTGASDEARSSTLKATSQDEYILGFQTEIAPKWTAGIKGTYRVLNAALEDTCFYTPPPNPGDPVGYGCVILNPGSSVTLDGGPYSDYDFDGSPNTGTIPASDIGLPKAKRKYYAATFTLDRKYDRKWFFSASYTWSHLYGNYEGLANSDNDQADPGISIAFDTPYLVTSGNLPNDHRHTFKLYGAYDVTEEVEMGLNFSAQSGSPLSAFGALPVSVYQNPNLTPSQINDVVGGFNAGYEGSFPYVNGAFSPRGAGGTLPWIVSLDLSTRYKPRQVPGLELGVDVYNLLGADKYFAVEETKELNSGPNPFYGAPRAGAYQQPRTLRLSVKYELQ